MTERLSGPDFAAARQFALTRLREALPAGLHYHSLWHTQSEVAPRAVWLAHKEGLPQTAQTLVATAAYFHDIGFSETRADHERVSARIASEVLPALGYAPAHIGIIQNIIMATRLPQMPRTLLECIVADADLDVLGQGYFLTRNRELRRELAAAGAVTMDLAWYSRQLQFLAQHRYFTATARADRAAGKRRNRAILHDLIHDNSPRTRQYAMGAPRFYSPATRGARFAPVPVVPFDDPSADIAPTLR